MLNIRQINLWIYSCTCFSGTFELTDFEGRSTGTIAIELKWKFSYLQPADSVLATDLSDYIQNEKPVKGQGEGPVPPSAFSSPAVVSCLKLYYLV